MTLRQLIQGILPPFLLTAVQCFRQGWLTRVARRRLAGCDRLHLACGANLIEGWGNVCLAGPPGVVKYDLTRPLPVTTGSIRYIFNEHFIEHITREEAAAFFIECHRVLAPGGVMRLSTPSLEGVVSSYSNGGSGPRTACRLINDRMRNWGHQFLYDRPELVDLVTSCGFRQVTAVTRHLSSHPELSGLECRPDHGELIIEAEK